MFRVEEIQTAGCFVMMLFVVALLFVPKQIYKNSVKERYVYNTSRWYLIVAIALLAIHYFLQHTFGFRHMESLQAPVVNLVFYTPAGVLINLGMLNLLRSGKLKLWEAWFGAIAVMLVIGITATGTLLSKEGFLVDSDELEMAAHLSSIVYCASLLVYNILEYKQYKAISRSLDVFYDTPMQSLIHWFAVSMTLLAISAVLSPVLIYSMHPVLLGCYALLMFVLIPFYVFNFLYYGVGDYMHRVHLADENSDEIEVEREHREAVTWDELEVVERRVARWLESRRYMKAGVTMAEVASEMGISRSQLANYIQSRGCPKIGSWLALYRIKEAKNMIKEYPHYSLDAIAEECGFSSRSYFQKVFRELEEVTPAQYREGLKGM